MMVISKAKYFLLFLIVFGILLFTSFSVTFPEHPTTGFWTMEDTLVTHPFEEKTDSLSGPELFELQALGYFQPELLADTSIQLQLIQVMPDSDTSIKYEILWKFSVLGQIHPKVVVNLLEMFTSQQLGIGTYNLILRLITPEHLNNSEEIVHILNKLSEVENGYIRNLTKRTLDEKNKTFSQ
jgi:hypothetical protein